MLNAAISFFILALVAFVFGAYGIAGISIEIGKILLIVFLVLSAISFIFAVLRGKKQNPIP